MGKGLGVAVCVIAGSLLFAQGAFSESKGDAQSGKAVFESRCAVCHGADGRGDGPAGKAMKPNPAANFSDKKFMSSRTDAQFSEAIKKGLNAMPPFASMSDKERRDVIAYIRTSGK